MISPLFREHLTLGINGDAAHGSLREPLTVDCIVGAFIQGNGDQELLVLAEVLVHALLAEGIVTS